MMSLVVVVMSIALTALFMYGGISYFSHDINIKTEVAHVARAHYEVMAMGVVNYKVVNDSRMPTSIDELVAYLPKGEVPKYPKYASSGQPFSWGVEGDYICMYRTPSNQKLAGVDKGVARFLASHAKQNTIKVGSTCAGAASGSDTTSSVGFNEDYIMVRDSIAFAFEVN